MDDLWAYFEQKFDIKDIKLNQYSPLVMAYIGDAIYDMIIRTIIVYRANTQVNKMHHAAMNYVKASAQAEMYFAIKDRLTEEEEEIFKRGRNTKSYTKAKNATVNDYRIATGFETLMGYLYLKKDFKRILDLVSEGIEVCDKQKNS